MYLDTMIEDWVPYANYNGPFGKMHFIGVLSQWRKGETWLKPGDNCGLTPQEGWSHLLAKIPQNTIPYLSNIVCHT